MVGLPEERGVPVLLGQDSVGPEEHDLGQVLRPLQAQLRLPELLREKELPKIRPVLSGRTYDVFGQRLRGPVRESQDFTILRRVGSEIIQIDFREGAGDADAVEIVKREFDAEFPPSLRYGVLGSEEIGFQVAQLDLEAKHIVIGRETGLVERSGVVEGLPYPLNGVFHQSSLLLGQKEAVIEQPHLCDDALGAAPQGFLLEVLEAAGPRRARQTPTA